MCGCIGSCLGSCAATCCCSALTKCGKSSKGSLIPYLILLVISVIIAIVLRYHGGPLLFKFYSFNETLCDTDTCVGYGGVYRISFALFIFFIIHAIVLSFRCGTNFDSSVAWYWHYLLYIILFIIAFLIPQVFYDQGYVHVARVISGLFLFLQIVILVDFAYNLNEDWISDSKQYYKLILLVSFILYAACITLIVFYFLWFTTDSSGCHRNKFFIAWTIISFVIFTIISLSDKVKSGVLPSGVVALYCVWLLYTALISDPSSCNSLATGSQDTLSLILGLIIGALSISYSGWNVATNNSLFGGESTAEAVAAVNANNEVLDSVGPDNDSSATTEAQAAAAADADAEDRGLPKEKRSAQSSGSASSALTTEADLINQRIVAKRNIKFHLLMSACAMYMAMLLTNWGSTQSAISTAYPVAGQGLTNTAYDYSIESMWIKIVSQWITSIVYIWTLIAPLVCSGRDFS